MCLCFWLCVLWKQIVSNRFEMSSRPTTPPHKHSPRYMMPVKLDEAMGILNIVFTLYFVVEFMIRVTGAGPNAYFSSGMNWWVGHSWPLGWGGGQTRILEFVKFRMCSILHFLR